MLVKLNNKSDKKAEKQIHPISVQTTDFSSKQSEKIQDEVLTITSEHKPSEDKFEKKPQEKISPSNQRFEEPEEELTEFKG